MTRRTKTYITWPHSSSRHFPKILIVKLTHKVPYNWGRKLSSPPSVALQMALIYPTYDGVAVNLGRYRCFHMIPGDRRHSPPFLSLRAAFRAAPTSRFIVRILYNTPYLAPANWIFALSPTSPSNGVSLIGCVLGVDWVVFSNMWGIECDVYVI